MREHTQPVEAVAIAPDGQTYATGSWDGHVRLWDKTGRLRVTLPKYDTPVLALVFNKTGQRLAVGTGKPGNAGPGQVYVIAGAKGWAAPFTSKALNAKTPTGPVYSVAFLPDGRTVVSSSRDKTLRLRKVSDADGGRVLRNDLSELRADQVLLAAALSPDGKLLVTCAGDWKAKSHGEISLWSAETLERVAKLPRQESPVWSAAFSRNGKQLYAAGGGLDVWDVATRKKLRRVAANQSIRCVVVSPDGRFVAAGTQSRPAGRTLIFETATWQEVASLGDHQKLILGMSYSPSGLLATASGDGSVILWRNQPDPAPKRTADNRAAGTPVPVK